MYRPSLALILASLLGLTAACSDEAPPLPSGTTTGAGAGGGGSTSTGSNVASGWRNVDTERTETLNAVWARSADDVWAVGDVVILHYDGMEWLRIEPGDLPNNTGSVTWEGVTGSGATDVWVSGTQADANGPVLIHFDGTDWSTQIQKAEAVAGETYGFFDAHATADGTWLADGAVDSGDGGHGYFFDGTDIIDRVDGEMRCIALADDRVFFGTNDGQIMYFDGSAWATPDVEGLGLSDSLLGIHALSSDDVWAVGPLKRVHFDGASWETLTGMSGARAVWGATSNDVWLVGDAFEHYDGTTWTVGTPPRDVIYRGIYGTADDDIWAVGEDGAIAHFGG